MVGLATSFGSGAMTNSIGELEGADVLLVTGSNTTETHPQIGRNIITAKDKGAKLIVIDHAGPISQKRRIFTWHCDRELILPSSMQ